MKEDLNLFFFVARTKSLLQHYCFPIYETSKDSHKRWGEPCLESSRTRTANTRSETDSAFVRPVPLPLPVPVQSGSWSWTTVMAASKAGSHCDSLPLCFLPCYDARTASLQQACRDLHTLSTCRLAATRCRYVAVHPVIDISQAASSTLLHF